jgi:hypothetical protein
MEMKRSSKIPSKMPYQDSAVRINQRQAETLLNSKSEMNHPPVA